MKNMNDNETVSSSEKQPRKPQKLKTRQVSSRFLSPISSPKHDSKKNTENSRPSESPMQRKPSLNRPPKTLADHLLRKSNDKNKGNVTLKENTVPHANHISRRNSDLFTGTSTGRHSVASNGSTRKLGKQVMSRYLHDLPASHHVMTPDRATHSSANKFSFKDIMIKRSNSFTGYGSSMSQWALSPGRSGFSPLTKEKVVTPLPNLSRLDSGPHKTRGMGRFLNIGFGLFKSKKSLDCGKAESIHQLRLLHNRLVQLRYVNARSNVVNEQINRQAERESICAWNSISKLQLSVLQKRLQLEREKIEMKLNLIVNSQIDKLEEWKYMKDENVSAVSVTKNCLYSVASKLPLNEDAQADLESMLIAVQDLTETMKSIDSTISSYSPIAEQTESLVQRLANVVAQEKLLLEEAFELLEIVSMLEIKERSLLCGIIQFTDQQKQIE